MIELPKITFCKILPDLPKPLKLRRQVRKDGGYDMVPAYTDEEMFKYGEVCAAEARADALQALERVPMTWQSIDTAPKDGTNVLLYFSGLGWVRGSWDSQIHHRKPKPYWTHDCIQYMGVAHARANQPNWWKPLPPTPPESKG